MNVWLGAIRCWLGPQVQGTPASLHRPLPPTPPSKWRMSTKEVAPRLHCVDVVSHRKLANNQVQEVSASGQAIEGCRLLPAAPIRLGNAATLAIVGARPEVGRTCAGVKARLCVRAPPSRTRCRWEAAVARKSYIAWLDGRHAVFVAQGMDIGKNIEAMVILVYTTTFYLITKP